MTDAKGAFVERGGEESGGRKCDFCQDEVTSVRRVALDGDYERLRTPHVAQYACPDCFEKKDRLRLELSGAR